MKDPRVSVTAVRSRTVGTDPDQKIVHLNASEYLVVVTPKKKSCYDMYTIFEIRNGSPCRECPELFLTEVRP